MPLHSSHLSGFHMSNFGVWIIETSTNGNPKSTESGGMDANKPHFRTLVSLKDDLFSLWFRGGVESVENTRKFLVWNSERNSGFPNWGERIFSKGIEVRFASVVFFIAILQVVYRHLGREQDRDSPIQNRNLCSKEMVITRKEHTYSRRCASYKWTYNPYESMHEVTGVKKTTLFIGGYNLIYSW